MEKKKTFYRMLNSTYICILIEFLIDPWTQPNRTHWNIIVIISNRSNLRWDLSKTSFPKESKSLGLMTMDLWLITVIRHCAVHFLVIWLVQIIGYNGMPRGGASSKKNRLLGVVEFILISKIKWNLQSEMGVTRIHRIFYVKLFFNLSFSMV